MSILVRRPGIVIRSCSSSHACSSLSSDRAAETSPSWGPSVTMNLWLRHSIGGGVSRGMSNMEMVDGFDSGS